MKYELLDSRLGEKMSQMGYGFLCEFVVICYIALLVSLLVTLVLSGILLENKNRRFSKWEKRFNCILLVTLSIGVVTATTQIKEKKIKNNARQQLIIDEVGSDNLYFLQTEAANWYQTPSGNGDLKDIVEVELEGKRYLFDVVNALSLNYNKTKFCNELNACLSKNDYKGVWVISYDGGETYYLSYANFKN